jgi:hypothetical protein
MTPNNISAYPLAWPAGWPRARDRKGAQFNKREPVYRDGQRVYDAKRELSVNDATKRVLYELERLGVGHGDAIISTNLVLRLDGLPRSDQRMPDDPGVAVYWRKDSRSPMRVMAIDRYTRVADNLAAIAATLEAMRAIERHGGAQILERAFTGFDALPPPMTTPAPKPWHEVLGFGKERPTGRDITPDEIQRAYRDRVRAAHPDTGGSHDAFAELSRARDQALEHLLGGRVHGT